MSVSTTEPPPAPVSPVSPADTLPPQRVAGAKPATSLRIRSKTKRLRYLALWSRQLCVLVRSGTPLVNALHAVERQAMDARWATVLGDVRNRIDQGAGFSEALEHHPRCFDPVTRSLVAAGESSGQLEVMLDRLASLTRQQLKVRKTIAGAMVYPSLLLTVAGVVLVAMIVFVFPRFTELFHTLEAPLPPSTKLLVSISNVLRDWWWMLVILGVTALVGTRLFAASPQGRRSIDGWTLALPGIGKMAKSFGAARFARLLGSLIQSRVPMLEALVLTRHSAGNCRFADLIHEAEEHVVKGQSLSSVLAASSLISPALAEAVRHGEQSGQMGPVLTDMADFMDDENEILVRTLSSVLEPVILILLGVVVAFVALSMFLPLFDLTSMT